MLGKLLMKLRDELGKKWWWIVVWLVDYESWIIIFLRDLWESTRFSCWYRRWGWPVRGRNSLIGLFSVVEIRITAAIPSELAWNG
jgi:hypothetical protein